MRQASLSFACLALSTGFASAWTGDGSPGSGFVVDRSDRNDVLSFYHEVYRASEGFENRIGWTGTYAGAASTAGSTSAAFVEDVKRRVNYYRAMVGVPADAQFNTGTKVIIGTNPPDAYSPPATTTKAEASQRSALMMAVNHNSSTGANPAFTHDPPSSCVAWSAAAWNANNRGNLAVGTYGPRSVDVYFKEDKYNIAAGHRRWLIHRQLRDYATGDTPGSGSGGTAVPASNNLYVIHRSAEANTSVPALFVAYPGAGFFPATLNSDYWSLSYSSANFASATITMTPLGGSPITIASADISRTQGYGENAIVWKVPAAAAATHLDADRTFEVKVSNIGGITGVTSHTYQVTLVSPNRLPSPLTLNGSASPPVAGANYSFTPVPHADGMELAGFRLSSTAWTEGAEPSSTPQVVSRKSSNYDLLSNVPTFFQGTRSFRLTFGSLPLREEMFELDRDLVPGVLPKLIFSSRRGYMKTNTTLFVEQSNDGGASWSELTKFTGTGGAPDSSFGSPVSLSLIPGSQPIRVRFRLAYTGSDLYLDPVYTHSFSPSDPTGIFIDSISTTGCQWLEKTGGTILPGSASQASFNSAVAGTALVAGAQYQLRLRANLGGNWFYYGPPKAVVVTGVPVQGYAGWLEYEYPTLVGQPFAGDSDGDGIPNGIEFAFSLDPMSRQTWADVPVVDSVTEKLTITRPLPAVRSGITYGAEWSDDLMAWSSTGVVVTTTGGQAVASVPMIGEKRYLRWKITSP